MPCQAHTQSLDAVPASLIELAQWVCWKYIERGGKQTKVPFNPKTGGSASTTDPTTWSSFEDAVLAWRSGEHAGVGFVFTSDDPFCGIDLDDCIDDEGNIVSAAQAIIDGLDSYTEVSPSGKGVKVFISGRKPEGLGCKSKALKGFRETEVYDHGRFFTVTGMHVPGTPQIVLERQAALEALCEQLWTKKSKARKNRTVESSGFSDDDDALIKRASSAANGDRFKTLWSGDTSSYADDHSGADQALCNMLAFWTDKDAARMDRLFRRSGLFRHKWDEKRGAETYGARTINKAVADCHETYSPSRNTPPSARAPQGDAQSMSRDSDDMLVPLGQIDPDSGRLVLSPQQTLPTAQAYVREFCQHEDGRTLHSIAGDLLEWHGNRYRPLEDGFMKHRLQPWLHTSLRYVYNRRRGIRQLDDFESNPTTVNHALESIKAHVHLPVSTTSPSWLSGHDDLPPASEMLACRTMNLHIPTGHISAPTPRLFTTTSLDFDYQPDAESPERWFQFLQELFGDDQASIDTLQEAMGYFLTCDTSQQKILLIVGPRRSGKGTIGRVLQQLVGVGNVVSPTTGSLAGEFGLQPLIGKSLAIVSDARFSGEKMSVVVERLLCISGEDTVTINRKFRDSVSLKLPTRFVFLTNELPRLNDASTALTGRFLVLQLKNSYYGHEDRRLTDKLVLELPGILNWALQGWKRLQQRGHFLQPESGANAVRDMEDLASPVGAFIREECVIGAGYREPVGSLYDAWMSWSGQDGRNTSNSKQVFGRDLAAAAPGVVRRRGTNATFYEGIKLRSGGDE
jgi:P4 family phage/plasmid primase-like protien